MIPWNSRTELLLGREGVEALQQATVLVVGVGGVGGFVVEFLARAGIGSLVLVDFDEICASNRNRQIQALEGTESFRKVDILRERILQINPELQVSIFPEFVNEENLSLFLEYRMYDFVVDAIDTVGPKVHLIAECVRKGIPLVSSFGSAGKMDPSQIRIADVSETFGCPLGRHVRTRLRKMGIEKGFPAVFSPEPIDRNRILREGDGTKASTVGTISYLPAMFGGHAASVVIRGILKRSSRKPVTERDTD